MLRLIPIPSILLFLLLLNLVQSLDYNLQRQTNSTLDRRDDIIVIDIVDSPDDDNNDKADDINGEETTPVTTQLDNAPTVTTIIIIQTTVGQTFRELGDGGPSNTATNIDTGATDSYDDNLETEETNDDSALKRMISIPSVIGGVAVIAIIGGTIAFMRLRAKRRHAKALQQCQELSTTYVRGNEGGNGPYGGNGTYTHHGGGHQRQHSNLTTTTYVSQQGQHQLSASGNRDYPATTNTVSPVLPSAPLEPTISHTNILRERLTALPQQFSPPSPILSTPIPSAPSTKELEMNAPADSRNVPHINTDFQSSDTSSSSSNYSHPLSSSTSTASPSPSGIVPSSSHLKSSNDTSSSQLPPDMPPPAYTQSAPPLFVLPPNQRRRSADQLSLDKYRRS